MSLNFVWGRASAGKTGAVLGALGPRGADSAGATLVVQQMGDARRLERELSGRAPIGYRVMTINDLVRELWALYGDGRRPVSASMREALMRRTLQELPLDPSRLEPSRGVVRFLCDAAVRAPGSAAPEPDDEATGVRRAARIVHAYLAALGDAGLIELSEARRVLGEQPPRLAGPIGALRFESMSSEDARFLVALAANNDVHAALTWEQEFAPTRANDAVAQILRAASTQSDRMVTTAEDPLALFCDELYSAAPRRALGSRVSFFTAAGEAAEAEMVASLVADELASGTSPDHVAVVFGTLASRRIALARAFATAGVPYRIEAPRRTAEAAVAKALGGLIRASGPAGTRSDVMAFLSSPFASVDVSVASELDRSWRQTGCSDPRRMLSDVRSRVGGVADEIVRTTSEVARHPIDVETVKKWQFILDHACSQAAQSGSEVLLAETMAACQSLGAAIGEMASVPGTPFGAGDLLIAMESSTFSVPAAEGVPAVSVAEPRVIGARRFDMVVIGGMTADEFSVQARGRLADELDLLLGSEPAANAADRQRLSFYSLVSRAVKRLCIVRQTADSEGRALSASVLWEEALDRLEGMEEPDSYLGERHIARSEIELIAPAFTEGRRELRSQGGMRRPSRSAHILSEEAAASLHELETFTVTDVETYLQCRYRWFFKHVYRPEDIDREFDGRELGTRTHALLSSFYQRLIDAGEPRVTESNLERALGLFAEVALEARKSGMGVSTLADDLAVVSAQRMAQRSIEWDARLLHGFMPVRPEIDFGREALFEFAGARFTGRIDRIDVGERACVVTDYKTSREVTPVRKFEQAGKVQAVVYAKAAQQLTGKPVAASVYRSLRSGKVRGFWRADLIGPGALALCDDDALTDSEAAEVASAMEERVEQEIADMRGGLIDAAPRIKGACETCPIRLQCEGSAS